MKKRVLLIVLCLMMLLSILVLFFHKNRQTKVFNDEIQNTFSDIAKNLIVLDSKMEKIQKTPDQTTAADIVSIACNFHELYTELQQIDNYYQKLYPKRHARNDHLGKRGIIAQYYHMSQYAMKDLPDVLLDPSFSGEQNEKELAVKLMRDINKICCNIFSEYCASHETASLKDLDNIYTEINNAVLKHVENTYHKHIQLDAYPIFDYFFDFST